MPATRRKKKTRQEGSHGWGSRKKHRGKGHKGGSGKSGTGKRTNPKEPSIWKDTKYFGKHGFIKKNIKVEIRPVNIRFLDENIEKLFEKKLAKKERDAYTINLEDMGFNKLLGSGRVREKILITTQYASSKAVESVKNAGGQVILPEKREEGKKEKEESESEDNKNKIKKDKSKENKNRKDINNNENKKNKNKGNKKNENKNKTSIKEVD